VTVRPRKRGRKALGKINTRKRVVRKFIKRKRDFSDFEIFYKLLSELDYEKIPPPTFGDGTTFSHHWVEVQEDPFLTERVIKVLNEDRWD